MAVPGNQLHPSDGLIATVSAIAVREVVVILVWMPLSRIRLPSPSVDSDTARSGAMTIFDCNSKSSNTGINLRRRRVISGQQTLADCAATDASRLAPDESVRGPG